MKNFLSRFSNSFIVYWVRNHSPAMRTILSHLFTAFLTYWVLGVYIVLFVCNSVSWPYSYKLETSLDWAYKFYIISKYSDELRKN